MSLTIMPNLGNAKNINVDSLFQLAIENEWGVEDDLDRTLAWFNKGWRVVSQGQSIYTAAQKVEFAALTMIRYMENYRKWSADDKDQIGAILGTFEELTGIYSWYEGAIFKTYLETSEKVHHKALDAAFYLIKESNAVQEKLIAYKKYQKVESYLNWIGNNHLDQFDHEIYEKNLLQLNEAEIDQHIDDIQNLYQVTAELPKNIQDDSVFWYGLSVLNQSLLEKKAAFENSFVKIDFVPNIEEKQKSLMWRILTVLFSFLRSWF